MISDLVEALSNLRSCAPELTLDNARRVEDAILAIVYSNPPSTSAARELLGYLHACKYVSINDPEVRDKIIKLATAAAREANISPPPAAPVAPPDVPDLLRFAREVFHDRSRDLSPAIRNLIGTLTDRLAIATGQKP